jgi:hypothetical protein
MDQLNPPLWQWLARDFLVVVAQTLDDKPKRDHRESL